VTQDGAQQKDFAVVSHRINKNWGSLNQVIKYQLHNEVPVGRS